jgi:hypothetical protein
MKARGNVHLACQFSALLLDEYFLQAIGCRCKKFRGHQMAEFPSQQIFCGYFGLHASAEVAVKNAFRIDGKHESRGSGEQSLVVGAARVILPAPYGKNAGYFLQQIQPLLE